MRPAQDAAAPNNTAHGCAELARAIERCSIRCCRRHQRRLRSPLAMAYEKLYRYAVGKLSVNTRLHYQ